MIPLSVPHLTGHETEALERAVSTNWIASVGPEVDQFEEEFAEKLSVSRALATTSGTAAIHLALRVLGVGPGDDVLVSTFTFCASVNPILYLGATPVFVDAEERSWNMEPALLEEELDRRGREGRLPAAVVVVHIYGQPADMTPILRACRRWSVPIVEDAAEALGAEHRSPEGTRQAAGTLGDLGIFSFDGSKMITTSMGGMLVSDRSELIDHARKLARQAREPVAHYQHEEIGYNYRMSNLLAGVGRVQLRVLDRRVEQRRNVFNRYRTLLEDTMGLTFQPEAPWSMHARWLTCVLLSPEVIGGGPEAVRMHLHEHGIETRPVWKPMHRQPVYERLGLTSVRGDVADRLYETGLCLPSSSSLTDEEITRVASTLRTFLHHD
ncbi:MAG: pyridoxal phosphate-dependent aminotransferase [Gemmatimonadales bacterium]|nr:MAG: pyridoxal phosphate-dependent aminotransferase [Gemmatimonadales bacterium]